MLRYAYIAGPYSAGDPVQNTRDAMLVGDELTGWGYAVYVPHLSLFWHFLRPHEIDFWYSHDIAWLLKCDVLVRLGGESEGADNEVQTAHANGILVCHWPQDSLTLRTLAKWQPAEECIPDGPDD